MSKYVAITLSALLLLGCSSDVTTLSESEKPAGYTVFDTTNGDIPYPNNILFAGSKDGTLNFNASEDDSAKPIKDMLDTLDGFSTTSAISVSVTAEIDSDTLAKGVHLYKVLAQASEATNYIPAVGAIEKELTFGSDYIATYSEGKIVILPLVPLEANSNYMVVLTNEITNAKGQPLSADGVTTMINGAHALVDASGESTVYFDENDTINNATASKLEGLRQLNQAMEVAMLKNGVEGCSFADETNTSVECSNLVMSWSFKTQSIGKVAKAFVDYNYKSAYIEVNATGIASAKGTAEFYTGFLNHIPYYLGVPTAQNPTAPLTDYFQKADPILPSLDPEDLPKERAVVDIPLFMSVPKENNTTMVMPESGWPVVIYQHGITRNRTDLAALADSFASAGYVGVAIDLPLHGVDTLEEVSKNFYVEGKERTFDMDFINNETGASGPDGVIDPSGSHYMNFASLLTARDNVRQSTSDLIALLNALSSAKGVKLDASRVAFVGHSLGTIASMPFVTSKSFESVTLAMPGAHITQLLNHSATKGSTLREGLQEVAGIEPDSPEYNSFLLSAQTILDDADPINYVKTMPASQRVFALEVIGDDSGNLPDQTIPNNAYPYAPLAGTDPMLTMLGAQDLNVSKLNEQNQYMIEHNVTVTRFTRGGHESLIDPTSDMITEMQTQVASFIKSLGTVIQVIDPTSIKP